MLCEVDIISAVRVESRPHLACGGGFDGALRSHDGGWRVNREDDLSREIEALRERLSRLTEASLRINESLDFDTVLQGGARFRPGADRRPLRRHFDQG